ncbi:MAG: sigma-70 family RNA polymerase sigma factor [Anaerolineae bacterium]|nr:sigma-70 family RNA polymerase sigma factor [Anaerolineae bacterium]
MAANHFASMPNTELIEACLKGNNQAWEALLVRYQRLIYSIPLRYGLPEHDANDVFQNVSLLLLENLDRLRDRQRLGAWLIVTTQRECWRMLRQQRRVTLFPMSREMEEQIPGKQHSEEDFLMLERQSIVRSAVGHLGTACKQLLKLLFYSEPRLSYAEISRRLGIPEGSIGPTRARCLGKLMKVLEKMGFSAL